MRDLNHTSCFSSFIRSVKVLIILHIWEVPTNRWSELNPSICIQIAESWSAQKLWGFFFPLKELEAAVVCSFYTTWNIENAIDHTVSCSLFWEMVPNWNSFLNTENNEACFLVILYHVIKWLWKNHTKAFTWRCPWVDIGEVKLAQG